tara:strand:- start:9757 stop:10722 length:966 start_codon:yes stop_codon:yes gene_type:complete
LNSVLLVGFGNVASTIDNDGRSQLFGHIGALNSLNIKISAVVENNPSTVAIDYCAKNNIRLFSDYKRILSSGKKEFDLGIFCLPTSKAAVIQEIINDIAFNNVLLEKPVSYEKKLAQNIFQSLNKSKTRFIINYQRNWDEGYKKISQWINNNKVTDAYFRTSTAIAQSGSHMLELIFRMFPKSEVVSILRLDSKRLVGNEVAEPGVAIHFICDKTNIFFICDSAEVNEFTFSGVIHSETEKLSFDEGTGEVTVARKNLGNKRIGPQITSYIDALVLHKWVNEKWIEGCYETLLARDNLEKYHARSIKVVHIIDNIMNYDAK